MMALKGTKMWSVTIDRKYSEEFIVKAKTMTEAKGKAWEMFTKKKLKKKDHQIYADMMGYTDHIFVPFNTDAI